MTNKQSRRAFVASKPTAALRSPAVWSERVEAYYRAERSDLPDSPETRDAREAALNALLGAPAPDYAALLLKLQIMGAELDGLSDPAVDPRREGFWPQDAASVFAFASYYGTVLDVARGALPADAMLDEARRVAASIWETPSSLSFDLSNPTHCLWAVNNDEAHQQRAMLAVYLDCLHLAHETTAPREALEVPSHDARRWANVGKSAPDNPDRRYGNAYCAYLHALKVPEDEERLRCATVAVLRTPAPRGRALAEKLAIACKLLRGADLAGIPAFDPMSAATIGDEAFKREACSRRHELALLAFGALYEELASLDDAGFDYLPER